MRWISIKSKGRTFSVKAKDAMFISSGIGFLMDGRVGKEDIMGEETLNNSGMRFFHSFNKLIKCPFHARQCPINKIDMVLAHMKLKVAV